MSVKVNRTGELDVELLGRLQRVRDLLPGRSAQPLCFTTSTTGAAVALRPPARVDALMVRVTTWGRPRFSWPLRERRVFRCQRLALASGASLPLVVRVWLSPRARAYPGRSADVPLTLCPAAAR